MKKSAIKGGKVQIKENESDLDPKDKGYVDEAKEDDEDEEEVEESEVVGEEKEPDEDDEEVEEEFDPNLDASAVNKKFKLLPEETVVTEEIINQLNLAESENEEASNDQVKSIVESFEKLFEDENLTKEFKEKAASIFEAAVNIKAKLRNEQTKKKAIEIIKENSAKARESVVNATERLLNHFANLWFKENRIAIVDGVQVELAESHLKATKDFLSRFNVKIPRSRENLVEKLSIKNAKLAEQLDAALNDQIQLRESLDKIRRENIIRNNAEGLSDAEKDKFVALAEEIRYTDENSYRTKLKSIREGVFDAGKKKTSSDEFASRMLLTTPKADDGKKVITESTEDSSHYVSAFKRNS